MRLLKRVWMVLLIVPMAVFAQTNTTPNLQTRPLSLQEALRLALEHNLEIEIGRYNPDIARYTYEATYGVFDPIFRADATHGVNATEGGGFDEEGDATQGVDTRYDRFGLGLAGVLPTGLTYDLAGTMNHTFGTREFQTFDTYQADVGMTLTQPLLRNFWIDANRMAIKVARKDLRISEYTFLFLVMDVINRTQQAYYELIASRDEIVAREKGLELAERFAQETRRKVEVGTLPPLEEKLAESQAAQARADLITARQTSVTADNVLKSLITDNYELWHGLVIMPTDRLLSIPESMDLGASWLNGVTLRPDFNALKEQVERQGIVVKFRRNQLFPSLDLVGTLGRGGIDNRFDTFGFTNITPRPGRDLTNIVVIPGRDASFSGALNDIREDTNPRYSYGVVFTTPLSYKRERNEHRAAKAILDQLQLQLKQMHQQILVEIDNAMSGIRGAFQRVDATRQAMTFAEAALDARQKMLEAGRATTFEVLQLQEDLTTARSAHIRALADYNQAIAQLAFFEGTILDRHKIVIEYR